MFGYFCIAVALFLTVNSNVRYRAIAYLVLFEFVAHQILFITGIQLTSFLEYEKIFLAYIIIQTFTLYLMSLIQSHRTITSLILINIVYNVLTISQYVVNLFDFYAYYSSFIGFIMIAELLYLLGITKYVDNYNKKHGIIDTDSVDSLFDVSRGIRFWGVS